jgi:hypothetical protein
MSTGGLGLNLEISPGPDRSSIVCLGNAPGRTALNAERIMKTPLVFLPISCHHCPALHLIGLALRQLLSLA